jgi:hypothetical protein
MNTWKMLILACLVAFVPLAALVVVSLGIVTQEAALWVSLAAVGLTYSFLAKDANTGLTKTTALPASGTAAAASAGIDLGVGVRGIVPGDMELLIEAPALTTGELADAATVVYSLYHDTASNFGTEVLLFDRLIVQTGADSAGAAAAEKRIRLPADTNRYIRVKATPSASTDKSAKSFTISLLF